MEARVETALKMFEINLPGGGGAFTRALYANGRQQCKVEMRIVKVTRSAPGQDWVEVPLTTAERQSATLVSYRLIKKRHYLKPGIATILKTVSIPGFGKRAWKMM
ncbi:hypothetical protein [Pseudomonas yamanorum]|uniref:hypothetical protein n=1 Tax=Pseudomonas yamanorum TaxID=515393 RepID=UPI003BA03EAC